MQRGSNDEIIRRIAENDAELPCVSLDDPLSDSQASALGRALWHNTVVEMFGVLNGQLSAVGAAAVAEVREKTKEKKEKENSMRLACNAAC